MRCLRRARGRPEWPKASGGVCGRFVRVWLAALRLNRLRPSIRRAVLLAFDCVRRRCNRATGKVLNQFSCSASVQRRPAMRSSSPVPARLCLPLIDGSVGICFRPRTQASTMCPSDLTSAGGSAHLQWCLIGCGRDTYKVFARGLATRSLTKERLRGAR